jgi:hypothetical protein
MSSIAPYCNISWSWGLGVDGTENGAGLRPVNLLSSNSIRLEDEGAGDAAMDIVTEIVFESCLIYG